MHLHSEDDESGGITGEKEEEMRRESRHCVYAITTTDSTHHHQRHILISAPLMTPLLSLPASLCQELLVHVGGQKYALAAFNVAAVPKPTKTKVTDSKPPAQAVDPSHPEIPKEDQEGLPPQDMMHE